MTPQPEGCGCGDRGGGYPRERAVVSRPDAALQAARQRGVPKPGRGGASVAVTAYARSGGSACHAEPGLTPVTVVLAP